MPTFTHNRVKNGVNGKQYTNMHPGNLFQSRRVSSNPANGKFASNVVTGRSFAAKRAIARRVSRQIPVKSLGEEGRRDEDGNIIVNEHCNLPTASNSRSVQKCRVNNRFKTSNTTSYIATTPNVVAPIISTITGVWTANSPISIPFFFNDLLTVNWNNEKTETYKPNSDGFEILSYDFLNAGDKIITISVAQSDRVRFGYGDDRTLNHQKSGSTITNAPSLGMNTPAAAIAGDANIFTALKSLEKLPSNYTLGAGDFKNAENLGSIDITDIDLSEDISEAFSGTGLTTIPGIDKLGSKMQKVKKMNGFLKNAKKMNDPKIAQLDTSSVEDKEDMFNGAESFAQDVTSWPKDKWKWENEDLETFFEGTEFSKGDKSDLFEDEITRNKMITSRMQLENLLGANFPTEPIPLISKNVGNLGESIRIYINNTTTVYEKIDTLEKIQDITNDDTDKMIERCESIFRSVKESYVSLALILTKLGVIDINEKFDEYSDNSTVWLSYRYYFESGVDKEIKWRILNSTGNSSDNLEYRLTNMKLPTNTYPQKLNHVLKFCQILLTTTVDTHSLNLFWGNIMPLLRENVRNDIGGINPINHYKKLTNGDFYESGQVSSVKIEEYKKEKGTIHWAVEKYISYGATDLDNDIKKKGRRKWNRLYPEYGFIDTWNLEEVKSLQGLFKGKTTFNEDITKWNTMNVEIMAGMFMDVQSFNQPIGSWNTRSVLNMNSMFRIDRLGLTSIFNQPIGSWNTQKVKNMDGMFKNNLSFNQNLSSWELTNINEPSEFNGIYSGGLFGIFIKDSTRTDPWQLKEDFPLLKTVNTYLKKDFWKGYWSKHNFGFVASENNDEIYKHSTVTVGTGTMKNKVSYIKELKDGVAHFIEIKINDHNGHFTNGSGNLIPKDLYIKSGNEANVYGPIIYSSSKFENSEFTIKYNLNNYSSKILSNNILYWFSFTNSDKPAIVTDNIGSVSITGTYEVDNKLTAVVTDNDGITQNIIKYQWLRSSVVEMTNSEKIGTNSIYYTLLDGDKDKYVSVKATYTDDKGNITIGIEPSILPQKVEANSKAPILTETNQIQSSIDPTPTYNFNSTHTGIISSNYPFTTSNDAVIGDNKIRFSSLRQGVYDDIWVKVTTSTNFVSDQLSVSQFSVLEPNLVNHAGLSATNDGIAYLQPKIMGSVFSDDNEIECRIVDNAGGGNLAFQWQRISGERANNTIEDIIGATSYQYKLTTLDVGKRIRCFTTYTDGSGNNETMKTWYSRVITDKTTLDINSSSGNYKINTHGGTDYPTLTFERGITYTLNLLVSGHPLRIQKNRDLTSGLLYSTGLSHIDRNNVETIGDAAQDKEDGTFTFTIPTDAPDKLFYRCQYHNNMVGEINIVSNKLRIYYKDQNLKPIVDKSTEIVENLISRFKKDYNVVVTVKNDMPSGTIASASYQSQTMNINSNNFNITDDGTLNDKTVKTFVTTFIHELFHVFELVATKNKTLFNTGTGDPPYMYTGSEGLQGYKSLISENESIFTTKTLDVQNMSGVPIEDDFGPGTQFYHWEEGLDRDANGTISLEERSYNGFDYPILRNELMTGIKDSVNSYLTPMTAGALKDVGHTINENSDWITKSGTNMKWV